MALAIARNFGRETTAIFSKASKRSVSDGVPTELWGWQLAELRVLNRAFLFCVPKTGRRVSDCAALLRPLKLAYLDAWITVELPRRLEKQLHAQGWIFSREFVILFIFSGKEVIKPLGLLEEHPLRKGIDASNLTITSKS